MKAIRTRYLPAGNVRGARIKASDCDGNSATIGYPHEYSGERTHWEAAAALCRKMGWSGTLAGGALGPGEYAFTFDGGPRYVVLRNGESVTFAPAPEVAPR